MDFAGPLNFYGKGKILFRVRKRTGFRGVVGICYRVGAAQGVATNLAAAGEFAARGVGIIGKADFFSGGRAGRRQVDVGIENGIETAKVGNPDFGFVNAGNNGRFRQVEHRAVAVVGTEIGA